MSGVPLIVGYGNVLRSDDGLGPLAAERLADDPRVADATVLVRHQLTLDLVIDMHEANLVVFIDASRDLAPGSIAVQDLTTPAADLGPWTHQVSAAALVALAAALYGMTPSAVLVSMGVASVDAGDRLTPIVQTALPALVDAVVAAIGARQPSHA